MVPHGEKGGSSHQCYQCTWDDERQEILKMTFLISMVSKLEEELEYQ